MPVEGRSPDLGQERKVARPRRLAQGLPTPRERVRKLQTSLQAKATAEPAFRFYRLWDKICRADARSEGYRRCRHKAGALGFFSSRRRHTRLSCDWSSDVCS